MEHRGNTVTICSLQTNSMELYLDLHSQPCRSVFMFARVVGIPFDFKNVDLSTWQQYSEEFGRINCLNKIPVMKDGDFILTESIAILKYLVQKHSSSVGDYWYPADLQQRARVNEYLSWQHTNLRGHGSKISEFKIFFPAIMGSEAPKEKLDAAVEDLNKSISLLEEKFLQNKPFIIGDKISLADLVAVVGIMQPIGLGLDVLTGRPKLAAWRDRVKKELGEGLFEEAHELINNVAVLQEKIKKSSRLEELRPMLRKIFK